MNVVRKKEHVQANTEDSKNDEIATLTSSTHSFAHM